MSLEDGAGQPISMFPPGLGTAGFDTEFDADIDADFGLLTPIMSAEAPLSAEPALPVVPMANLDFFSFDLDFRRRFLASIPTSLSQHWPPSVPDLMAPMEVPELASTATTFNDINLPNIFEVMPYSQPSVPPVQNNDTSLSIIRDHPKPAHDDSLPTRKRMRLLPKTLATSQEIDVGSARMTQIRPTSFNLSTYAVSASHTTTTVAHCKLKRVRSPDSLISGIPKDSCANFQVTGAAAKNQQQPRTAKRKKVGKACLRCQSQNLGVSRKSHFHAFKYQG